MTSQGYLQKLREGRYCGSNTCLSYALFTVFRASTTPIIQIGIVNLHGLSGMLGPFHILLMHHDLLNEQSQQFRRQFRDARVPFCFGNEVVGTGNRRFQFFNCLLFLRDGDFQQHEQFRAGEGSYPQSRAERKLPLHLPRLPGNGRPQGLIRSPSENEPRKNARGRLPQRQESL